MARRLRLSGLAPWLLSLFAVVALGFVACSEGDQTVTSCYRVGADVMCTTAALGSTEDRDVDGDGRKDSYICSDADDLDDDSDFDSELDSDSEADSAGSGHGEDDGDSDTDSDDGSDSDDDGIPDAIDCDETDEDGRPPVSGPASESASAPAAPQTPMPTGGVLH